METKRATPQGAGPSTTDLIGSLESALADASGSPASDAEQAAAEVAEESANAHINNALTILAQPDDEIDELDLASVRDRLRRALAQLEYEGRPF